MNVNTMEMDPRIARIHYRDYLDKVKAAKAKRAEKVKEAILQAGRGLRVARVEKDRLEKEDEQLMAAFRELARGKRILNVRSVLQAAGLNAQSLPNLAIARADWQQCHFQAARQDNGVAFSEQSWLPWNGNRASGKVMYYPAGTFGTEATDSNWRRVHGLATGAHRALVPAIPARFRPDDDLSNYHILWEAVWTPAAPVDPFLLKHISGDHYTVLAQWDLTPIEQSVLAGRL